MTQYATAYFKAVKIVVKLDRYGSAYCFHIDPGDGSTMPIYLDEIRRDRLTKRIHSLRSDHVNLTVYEVPWSIGDSSGIKRYLQTIKESHAPK